MLSALLPALAVLLLTAIAFLLGFRARGGLTPEAAMAEAARIPGFRPQEACVATDGRAALVLGADRRVVLLTLPGDRPVARLLPRDARVARVGEGLLLDLGEPLLRRVRFSCAAAPAWLEAAP
ncbi:MAG: hypothetical protein SNJ79_08085 [Sphingomonadaceae bacterium]